MGTVLGLGAGFWIATLSLAWWVKLLLIIGAWWLIQGVLAAFSRSYVRTRVRVGMKVRGARRVIDVDQPVDSREAGED
jgi:hypothetical protein